ncbi:MAG TPA: FecR domain-containing protein, partial [Alphaproteobacteria bacterium]|nr:FecR domain-containing protein [Alphaproteobacteria bacterium]
MATHDSSGNSSDFLSKNDLSFGPSKETVLQASGERVELSDASFVRDADITREGMDLVLTKDDGSVIVIEGYFAAVPAPMLVAPDGSALTPALVNSFVAQPLQYAQATETAASDESPVGGVQEVTGTATVTRVDGTVETIQIGTPIYQGDVIETDAEGAVNIVFIDETSFAVSEDARLAIDEYVFDPSTQTGSTNFSVLKGVFVFTSGMIGREDPDDVQIETPVGSIGIRGTIIAGNVSTGEITVVEGAIVLKDFNGNEMTLALQFESARFNPATQQIEPMGQMAANQVINNFSSIAPVSPQLFSSIGDAARENATGNNPNAPQTQQGGEQQPN